MMRRHVCCQSSSDLSTRIATRAGLTEVCTVLNGICSSSRLDPGQATKDRFYSLSGCQVIPVQSRTPQKSLRLNISSLMTQGLQNLIDHASEALCGRNCKTVRQHWGVSPQVTGGKSVPNRKNDL